MAKHRSLIIRAVISIALFAQVLYVQGYQKALDAFASSTALLSPASPLTSPLILTTPTPAVAPDQPPTSPVLVSIDGGRYQVS